MSITLENLEKIVSMQIVDSQIYNMYAKLARREGYSNIANSLREIAIDEKTFADHFSKLINHYKRKNITNFHNLHFNISIPISTDKKIKALLGDAIEQVRERLNFYETFIKSADREGLTGLREKLNDIIHIEKSHENELKLLRMELIRPGLFKRIFCE